MKIRGLEWVDLIELQNQRALTEALWAELTKHFRSGSQGRIEAFLSARDILSATALTEGFLGWDSQIDASETDAELFHIKIVTDVCYLTRAALIDLMEVMLVAAVEYDCTFDGLGVSLTEVVHRPWWRFW